MKKVIVSNEDALAAIARAKTQEEAMELLKNRYGANTAISCEFWFAFYYLPAGNASQNNQSEGEK